MQNNKNNRHKKYIKEDKLLVQPRLVNNNKKNDIPLTKVANKKNLVNNYLLMKLDKKLIVEPQNKKKELRNKPVDYIYNEKLNNLTDLGKQNQQLSQNYQGTYDRDQYWYPLWMQYNYPNIKMYDMKVLVPSIISDSSKVDSSDSINTSSKTSRSTFKKSSKDYSLFNEPIPLIVKKKSKNEHFRQRQPRVTRHSKTTSRTTSRIRSRTKSKPIIKYSGFGKRKQIDSKKGKLSTSNNWGNKGSDYRSGNVTSSSYYGGPYLYYPFGNYYYYNRYGLPFSLDNAIVPITMYNKDFDEEDKQKEDKHKKDKYKEKNKKKEDKKKEDKQKDKKEDKKKEGFKNEVSIPNGYRTVILRIIEIDDSDEYNKEPSNLILILILSVIVIYYLYNKYKKNI